MKVVGKTLRFELPHGRLETLQREFNGHNDIEDPEASISNGLDPEASTTDEPNWVRWLRMPKKPKGDRHGTTTTTRTESKVKKVPHYPHLRRFVDNFLERAAGIQPFHFMAPLFEGFEEQTIRGDYKYRIALSIPYFSFKRIGDVDQSSKVSPAAAQQYPVQISDLTGGVKTERSPIDPTTEYGPLLDGDVHMSLTLDQFYYNFMRNVDHRNTDQVLYRHQERMTPAPKQEDRRICMVNQCWVLITDDDTIVTSTSEHQDGISNTIQEAISNHFTRDEDKRPEVSSALDMIPLILSLCCRQTIELKLGVGGENLLQVFGSDIARAANREVELFDQFILGLKAPNQPLPSSQASHNDGILEEIELLKEVKDILDELNIIKAVLLDQREILTAAFETLEQWDQRIYFGRQRAKKTTHLGELLAYYQRFGKLDTIGMEVAKLIHDAGQTRENINHLLDLRQKHANLSEAISARTSSENTARQGRTILVFTVVTIIFLPITFLSSLFALNITSFPHDTAGNLSYSPQWAYSRLFGITVAVSVPLITLAFFMNHIVGFVSSFLVRIANSNGNQTRNAGIDTADIARRVIPASADADGIREKAEQEQIWRRTWRRRPSDVENRNSRLPASQGTDDQGTVRFSRRLSRTDSLQSSRRRVANSTPMVR
ncbi:hypothetical protein F4861DRAFT_373459 [Xylaria intraflava]|nr:hypothetical protein F4861DRAFT_373459 [Xylaria intraflava]